MPPVCFACGNPASLHYRGLGDPLFGVSGRWDLARCASCRVLWLHPAPSREQIAGFYRAYYTHVPARPPARLQGLRAELASAWAATSAGGERGTLKARLMLSVPAIRDEVRYGFMDLRLLPAGRVLDVGCGSGEFLLRMREIGWEVEGLEFDPAAAAIAREQTGGIVHESDLLDAALPGGRFEAVTMSHVIEHVPDPLAYLREAHRLCRPGGRLVLATPNVDALGHRLFGASWRGLEVPRHLHLFAVETLSTLAVRAGFRVLSATTTARAARWFCISSRVLASGGDDAHRRAVEAPLRSRLAAFAFQMIEDAWLRASHVAGEEIVLVAERADAPDA